MICRLCLIESADNIVIFSEERIQKTITKFLQLQLTAEDPVSNVVCALCWQHLEDFQNFYFRIEEAQKSLLATSGELKKEVSQIGSEASNVENVFKRDSNLNLLKVEDLALKSDDETFDTSDTFHCLNEEIVKVEIRSEQTSEATRIIPLETNAQSSTRRITRGTAIKRQTTSENEIAPDKKIKRKAGRPKKVKDEDNKSEKVVIAELNVKIRRGRPKKGEERPKVQKVRSEKSERILETAKEFDNIIQKNMNLICNICTVSLIDFAELKRHFRAVHNRKGYAVCCNKRLYKRGLVVDHINTHNNPEYFKCTECGKVMADRMCLRNHVLLMHQNEDDKIYQCAYCPKKYAKQYLLDHHRVKHIPQEECTFICAECDRGFPTKATLTNHLNQMHSTLYDKMCEICAKLIRGNAAFALHMEEHEGIVRPQVQCEICGSWLKNKNGLRKHMYKHDGKSYSCNVCGKSAPSKSALQSHLKYVHQTVRQFHCTFCEKSFKKAVNLREHLTTHTGEVLYTCPHCPKTFNSKANMHAHRKKKHHEEWEANRRYNVKPETSTVNNSILS